MTSLRDAAVQAARRRLEPLTTSIAAPPQQTPTSAYSNNPLSAQFGGASGAGYNPHVYTPVSAVRTYNPQQWAASPSAHGGGGDHGAQYARRDPDTVTPAPPPYSPPRSNRPAAAGLDEASSGISPSSNRVAAPQASAASSSSPSNVYRASPEPNATPFFSPTNHYRSSPEPPANASFRPPPPPARPRQNRPQSMHFYNDLVPAGSPAAGRAGPMSPLLSPGLARESALNAIQTHGFAAAEPLQDDSAFESRPPASRRAASTGAIDTPSSSRSRASSTSRSRWEPGMPLPPPPPNPPPHSRSQSANRSSSSERITSPPTRRPGHSTSLAVSSLGPVPPTPAGWVDEDSSSRGGNSSSSTALHIDTSSSASSSAATGAPESNSGGPPSSGLSRARAVRGEPKSIRERRSESRTRAVEEPSNNPWASAIEGSQIAPLTIVGTSQSSQAQAQSSQRNPLSSRTPRSARSNLSETPRTGDMALAMASSTHSTPGLSSGGGIPSRGSTPRPLASASRAEAPTPPFSPMPPASAGAGPSALSESHGSHGNSNSNNPQSHSLPPKALPTPPQSRVAESPSGKLPASETPTPLRSSRPGSRQSASDHQSLHVVPPADQFARAAIDRHQAFAAREAAASSDTERVRIFAEFIVSESRLRREKYASAIDAMGSEILELTRDLFRPQSSRRESEVSRTSAWTPESSTGQRSHRGSVSGGAGAGRNDDAPLSSRSNPSPSPGPPSPALPRTDPNHWNSYMPSLSPIPSMSVSEALDGSDSRGRPSSRWWEVSSAGSIGQPTRLEARTKRESKYMGLPKELRERLQYEDGASTPGQADSTAGGSSSHATYGPNEYPPEKVGWHEQQQQPPSPEMQRAPVPSPVPFSPQPPYTPNPDHLDVSRLVTLPPPYPRHYPAVNNNHPDLTAIRTTVRSLSDFAEVEATKERFLESSARAREELDAAAKKRRGSVRAGIQREIEAGNMSFAEAAKAEADANAAENDKAKAGLKVDFENFQTQVVSPINDLLQDRVARAKELFEQLRSQLFVDAQQSDPTSTQEEGDEQPELLEKLKLLKWIFEVRELLEKELYDLLSDRNDRYKELMITPYRLAGNDEKVRGAEKFFAEDALRRRMTNEQEILKRTEEFMDIIEENVVRGVEVQLSAFWDIAPPLARIIDKIPRDLHGFHIQIPSAEYGETPAYYDHPMLYLHSLLAHCGKSTYQFIESQTNLLCLLHEVKGGVTAANCRLMRTQRVAQGEPEDDVERELREVEGDEEVRLTDDLKEKVRTVEEQWDSALGTELKIAKARIHEFLVEQGGWVDEE